MRRHAVTLGLALLLVLPLAASSPRRSQSRNPHFEIAAIARVETTPQRKTYKNRREIEEFDVTLLSTERPEGETSGDARPPIASQSHVHVVHDLSCGGSWLDAKTGDRIEIKGEYVHPARGRDLIHFTHAADGRCAGAAAHPDGYIRTAPPDLAAAAPASPPAVGDLFLTAIRPVLARRCVCHEKGGKMYERLPFDDPTVVSSHADGVRRRLKGDDLAALERWLATLSENPGSDP